MSKTAQRERNENETNLIMANEDERETEFLSRDKET